MQLITHPWWGHAVGLYRTFHMPLTHRPISQIFLFPTLPVLFLSFTHTSTQILPSPNKHPPGNGLFQSHDCPHCWASTALAEWGRRESKEPPPRIRQVHPQGEQHQPLPSCTLPPSVLSFQFLHWTQVKADVLCMFLYCSGLNTLKNYYILEHMWVKKNK